MIQRQSRFDPADRAVRLLLCLAFLTPIAACGGEEPEPPPVATPSLTMSRDRVAIGSPVELTYRFDVAKDAKIDGDYAVFVHALTPDGEQMWTDDHHPPTPTSKWQPGERIEYKRTIFVPNYPYVGEATFRMGLYQNDKRLVLSGDEASRREYVVARFTVVPQSENVFLVDKRGWHTAEVSPDNPMSEWKWTEKEALISFRNPRKDCTFYIEYDARVDLFTPPQQVTIAIGDQQVATFPADSKVPELLTFPITAEQLGPGDMAELMLSVDRTFKPGGSDTRELGIRVFHKFIEPK